MFSPSYKQRQKANETSVPSNTVDKETWDVSNCETKIQQTFFDMHNKVHEKVTKTPKCQKQRGT